MHLKKILFKKTLFTDFLFLAIIQSIYFIPLLIFGLDRIEDYQYNHFSVLVLVKNFFSPFIFFYDLLGPGTRLPLGSGLNFFFPTAIFVDSVDRGCHHHKDISTQDADLEDVFVQLTKH